MLFCGAVQSDPPVLQLSNSNVAAQDKYVRPGLDEYPSALLWRKRLVDGSMSSNRAPTVVRSLQLPYVLPGNGQRAPGIVDSVGMVSVDYFLRPFSTV